MTTKHSDELLEEMETGLLDMLKKKTLTNTERLKAIEAGAKILMIKHKISEGGGADGAFFNARK
jgi:hypothetical protein